METKLHYYEFDLSKKSDQGENEVLLSKLKAMGYKVFRSGSSQSARNEMLNVRIGRKTLSIDNNIVRPNQWNDFHYGLLFDWREVVIGLKGYKQGYYLEITDEMQVLRDNTFQCPICDLQYDKPGFCLNCVKIIILENDLPKAFLKPVSCLNVKVDSRNIYVPEHIRELFHGATVARLLMK